MDDLKDWRVMYQYFDPKADGPRFNFETVLAASEDEAKNTIMALADYKPNLSVIQVVPSNGVVTGFYEANVKGMGGLAINAPDPNPPADEEDLDAE